MSQHPFHRCAARLAAVLWFSISLAGLNTYGQDSTGMRRIRLQTYSIEGPAEEEWTTTARPDRDSVLFKRTSTKTLGLFGSDHLTALVISRIDERYTVAGEMMSKDEALEYHCSYFQNLFDRNLPRGGLGFTAFARPSLTLGGKDFIGVKVTNTWDGGMSEGQMYEYFPADYASRKAFYRFVANEIGEAGLVSWGGQPFKVEDVLASFTSHPSLEAYGGDGGTLPRAAAAGDSALVRSLVEKGATADTCTPEGTPLTLASRGGHLSIVRYLMEKGATVNARSANGFTPLMLAAAAGDTLIVRALIQRQADLDAKNDGGDTALEIADHKDHEAVVQQLKAAGAKD